MSREPLKEKLPEISLEEPAALENMLSQTETDPLDIEACLFLLLSHITNRAATTSVQRFPAGLTEPFRKVRQKLKKTKR